MSDPLDLEAHFARLNDIGIALSGERNLDALLSKILAEARAFTSAEAGSLYLIEDGHLRFVVAQNDVLDAGNVSAPDAPSGMACEAAGTKGGVGLGVSPLGGMRLPLTRDSMAGYVALTGEVINLEDAYDIPSDKPFRFNADFDRKTGFRSQSMLLVPMCGPAQCNIGALQLINARGDGGVVPFDRRYESLVRSLASQAAVAVRNVRLTEELRKAYFDTVFRLSVAVEYRDEGTADHIRRMAEYSVLIAQEMGFDREAVELINYAAPMHDIGKIGIRDAVLQKTGKLTDEEYDEMKQHTIIGARILAGSDAPILKLSAAIALTHHEKLDGTGYPNGLKGSEIPIEGQIVALADVFDALSSARCYKPAFPVEKCLKIITEERGRHFREDCTDAFLARIDDALAIRDRWSDNESDPLGLAARNADAEPANKLHP